MAILVNFTQTKILEGSFSPNCTLSYSLDEWFQFYCCMNNLFAVNAQNAPYFGCGFDHNSNNHLPVPLLSATTKPPDYLDVRRT